MSASAVRSSLRFAVFLSVGSASVTASSTPLEGIMHGKRRSSHSRGKGLPVDGRALYTPAARSARSENWISTTGAVGKEPRPAPPRHRCRSLFGEDGRGTDRPIKQFLTPPLCAAAATAASSTSNHSTRKSWHYTLYKDFFFNKPLFNICDAFFAFYGFFF